MLAGGGRPNLGGKVRVRDLRTDGVELVELADESGYVSLKCRDPDG